VLTSSAGGDVDSGCMRLQVTQEFYPPCIGSAKILTFLFFYGHFGTEKRKENENAHVFFGRKIKRRTIKMRFLAPKNKRKRNSVGL